MIVQRTGTTGVPAKPHPLVVLEPQGRSSFAVMVSAFGYKYGLPIDADLVFDVRFLPNPYFVATSFGAGTPGLDADVSKFAT